MSVSCNRGTRGFAYDNGMIPVTAVLHCPATVSETEITDDFPLSALLLLQFRDYTFALRLTYETNSSARSSALSHLKYNHRGILVSLVDLLFAQDNGHLWRFITRGHLYACSHDSCSHTFSPLCYLLRLRHICNYE